MASVVWVRYFYNKSPGTAWHLENSRAENRSKYNQTQGKFQRTLELPKLRLRDKSTPRRKSYETYLDGPQNAYFMNSA